MEIEEFAIKYWLEVLFGVIVGILGWAYKRLSQKVSKELSEQRSLHNGTKALLRNEIIRSYDKYLAQGWIPIYARENVLDMYTAYHALGGNGTVTKIMDELATLPSSGTGA
ncbi:MAG: hypothetical protein AB7E31_16270 [Desulfitobacterium sp.]